MYEIRNSEARLRKRWASARAINEFVFQALVVGVDVLAAAIIANHITAYGASGVTFWDYAKSVGSPAK